MLKFLEKIIVKFHSCSKWLSLYSTTLEKNCFGIVVKKEHEYKCDICDKIFKE